ncbi:MAG: hypothetical protein K2M14_05980 [Muribaculaceae bacterium]|nr:hypothetical protein [Bacteroidales bacterium]MDE6243540.1 hypothetical protein [Muribaculaceae bacterium]
MQKVISILMAAMVATIMSLSFTSCDNADSKLEKVVTEFNKTQAPMQIGGGVTLQKLSLDKTQKLLVYEFTTIEAGVSIDDIKPMLSQQMDQMLPVLAQDKNTQELFKVLSEADYGVKFEFTGKRSHKKADATIPASRVKELLK